jgi:geranylgeranyl diphosphate synthase type II
VRKKMSTDFELKEYLESRRQLVETALQEALPEQGGLEARVIEAMRYSLFAGGKRLRPILCLAAAEAVGDDSQAAIPAACALEMIHTYSLIHDDLPAMDDDDLRRGVPTNHKVFGEALAILAGDGLLTEAFSLLSRYDTIAPERTLQLIRVVAAAAGYRGMVGGQVVDMLSQNKPAELEVVQYMHRHKTAALISASTQAGALAGGGTEEQVARLGRYGRAVGLAFQITDDILDIEGDPALLGKSTGSDLARGKATFPAVMGLERSHEAARDYVEQALKELDEFGATADPLRAIANYIVTRKR